MTGNLTYWSVPWQRSVHCRSWKLLMGYPRKVSQDLVVCVLRITDLFARNVEKSCCIIVNRVVCLFNDILS